MPPLNPYQLAMANYVYRKPGYFRQYGVGPNLYGGTLFARALAQEMVQKSNSETAKIVSRYIRSMYRDSNKRADLRAMHEQLSAGAAAAALQAYEQSGIGGKPSYRYAEARNSPLFRFANGRMRLALGSPEQLNKVDDTGIALFNKRWLDKNARQWYRLNFGALPQSSAMPNQGVVRMFNKTASRRISLAGYGPSQAFFVPQTIKGRGIWSSKALPRTNLRALRGSNVTDGSGGFLYVVGPNFKGSFRGKVSKGIRGARFLDAGVRSVNNGYGPALTNVFRKWDREARQAAARGARGTINVRVKR